jgi:opacity protein-like surface antigen
MKKMLVAISLSTLLAASAFAAPATQRTQRGFEAQASAQYPNGQYGQFQYAAPQSNAVVFGGRVIGHDPDPNIRTQMLHDPVPYNQ